ncbi:NADH-quinone oxidoreductase subunit NuoN [Embleya sp. NPDC055664]|uniref:NADH-quinone oxidoreductase subunit N n=1 Tax=Embleya scabrispora TaxID=159449 RepID=A0A1T3NXW7_9ACTN|nr:NADH-quinone oxidoreductase subunit NuoN [Embleya scabrispora]OPC81521.1 NADH-quinone oxidoreductase subunit N [Embleya scabrispora]
MSTAATATLAVTKVDAPTIEYGKLSPVLIIAGVAVVGVLIEAFLPRPARYRAQLTVALVGMIAAFGAIVWLARDLPDDHRGSITAMGAIAVDGPSLFLQGTLLLIGIASVLLIGERKLEPAGGDAFAPQAAAAPGSQQEKDAAAAGWTQTEVYPLAMFSLVGMLLFPAANDLLMMFVALEILSLPLYLLCGLARRNRLLSQEAALKYFLLGAFSSAFFLFGVAMLYGYSGSVSLDKIGVASAGAMDNDALLLIGLAMVAVGLLFKVGAVPFHSWTPDVYQGAPTPITGFMAAATKVAAFGAMMRFFYVALPGMRWDWRPVMIGVAIATMVAGAVIAITQTDVKRLLAYSSIAHAGFILTGMIAMNDAGVSSTMFYLVAYGFVTLGAFAVVTLVRDARGEATHLSHWAGLGRRSPLVAGVFALFLLAFAGIPLTSGFAGKFAVFQAAARGGAGSLVVVGVLCSAIAAFFYVRVIVLMFFSEPKADGPTVVVPSVMTTAAIALGVAVTVVLGILPQPVLDLADKAALFVH